MEVGAAHRRREPTCGSPGATSGSGTATSAAGSVSATAEGVLPAGRFRGLGLGRSGLGSGLGSGTGSGIGCIRWGAGRV